MALLLVLVNLVINRGINLGLTFGLTLALKLGFKLGVCCGPNNALNLRINDWIYYQEQNFGLVFVMPFGGQSPVSLSVCLDPKP